MKPARIAILALFLTASARGLAQSAPDGAFVAAIKEEGREPVAFIRSALEWHDLIVFDEALHNASEPWTLYARLLDDPVIRRKVKLVFVEVLSTAAQPQVDAFLASPVRDLSLLAPALQDDYSGYGWRYQNVIGFLDHVRELNQSLPPAERIRAVGVSMPAFWAGIRTRAAYDAFLDSLRSFDHHMSSVIEESMGGFNEGIKGFFLTNTRHSYKSLHRRDGSLFWNATTFMAAQHPGRVFSVRIHNVALQVDALREVTGPVTAAGQERLSYRWVRMEGGAWDRAFAASGNQPVALPLFGNAFGRTAYVGNQMLTAAPGSTMADVHDAVIFLAPLENLTLCGRSDLLATPAFRQELRRRIQILEGPDLSKFLKDAGASSLDAFIEDWAKPSPSAPNRMLSPAAN